jgi:hypothetical protein
MKNVILICLFISTLTIACKDKSKHNAANETEENIYRSADTMLAAFHRGDWLTFAKYNHPAMMKMMGGQEAFAAFIAQQMKQIPDTAIKKIEAGKILQVVKTDKDQQCVLEQYMEMHMEGVKIKNTTYLVGESLDNGKTWTFFDASPSAMQLKDIKADISPALQIPAKKQETEKL